ncbi:dGTP triphosphohydrolase [Hyalangium versicolor]|uniref:dGTP triphosphohydrolase n=1 Tax=Hyalangium versicolor TaxID=2861190 RepID=UPI001CCF1C38|nr:dNTP triphosphohydrolase [Hyalangium versicolor]
MSTERNERWQQLLSGHRLGSTRTPELQDERTEFDKDYDRIVFSSAFRRLHDKTQVFPLSTSDYTRTRLTHSIEASCVGRTLGQLAGKALNRQNVKVDPSHLGTLVAAACLAHDIGNPPFGHSGEAAIQHWAEKKLVPPAESSPSAPSPFATETEWKDLVNFEGNAQGFRILSRLQARERQGGMRYTVATLGAMSKYPRPSVIPGRERDKSRISEKKFGYFQDDAALACEAYRRLCLQERGPGVFARHPLAFLVEAADDICYAVIDLEDSAMLGLIPIDKACALLENVARVRGGYIPPAELQPESRLGALRSSAIGVLIHECVVLFSEVVGEMEQGRWEQSLASARESVSGLLKEITRITREKGYESERVLQIESAGFRTLGGLLDMFASAVVKDSPNKEEKKLRQLLPLEFLQRPGAHEPDRHEAIRRLSPYQRLLCVTDYISGMTDGNAVELYQRLSGIKLPA